MERETPYIITFLHGLTPGTWYPIGSIPRVIGMAGLCDAHRCQILLPEYEIIMGRLWATFKIVRAKTAEMKIIDQIQKAI